MKTPKIAKPYLKQLIEQGKSVNEIAVICQCTEITVYSNIKRYGLTPPKHRTNKPGAWHRGEAGIKKLTDSGCKELAIAIIEATAKDYLRCAKGDEQQYRNFFTSEWFLFLNTVLDNELSGEYIIKNIEKARSNKNGKTTT